MSGAATRDSGNTGNLDAIRPGTLIGKITASGKFAPSILGVTTGAYTSGGLSITVSAAQAVEIVRRVGATGSLRYIGPPTAAGTVAISAAIAYSAINQTTGVITTADIGADKIAGTFVCANDGTHLPMFPLGETDGMKVTDRDGASQDQDFWPPVSGGLQFGQMLPLPTDTSLIAWVKTQLETYCNFIWDNDF